MAGGGDDFVAIEPSVWYLVFYEHSSARWVDWLAWGRFKHVSAIGFLPDQQAWVHYEVGLTRTRIGVFPAGRGADIYITRLRERSVVLAVPAGEGRTRWARVGFWCVPAMAHLIGLKRLFWRPDALFRACLAEGAEVVDW